MKSLDSLKEHWESWASEFGEDLRATTRSSNIKKLEIKALIEMLKKHSKKPVDQLNILEVGCGNGFNSISIAQSLGCKVDAFDFIPEMVKSARTNLEQSPNEIRERVNFFEGDVLNVDKSKEYDFVFSCRCLINLPSWELQSTAIKKLMSITSQKGALLLLENFSNSHGKQNDLREKVGLVKREVAEFNHFFIQEEFSKYIRANKYSLIDESNFSSLHDIVQYVIVPMINDGVVDYNHQVVGAITDLLLEMNLDDQSSFGEYGQNKLVVIANE